MQEQLHMKSTRAGVSSANIEGHQYKVPKDGVIKVVNPAHVETLKRHGFIEHFSTEDAADKIDAMEDKAELVTFIEERGGEADDGMSLKKLRRIAKETLSDDEA